MRLFIIALLFAISYAQTATKPSSTSQSMNPWQYKMMDEAYDGFPDMGDMYDFGDMGEAMMYGQMGGMGGGMSGFQMPSFDFSKLFGGNLGALAYMDGDMLEDALEWGEDMMEYQFGMNMMGGRRQPKQSGQGKVMMPRRVRRPSRLLQRPRAHRQLRKPREFPYWLFTQQNMNKAANTILPMFGYDGMDSEDRAAAIMSGINPASLPPPTDGIDNEDLWMFPHLFNRGAKKATTTPATDGTATAATTQATSGYQMPNWGYMWPWFSSLQRPRHVKY